MDRKDEESGLEALLGEACLPGGLSLAQASAVQPLLVVLLRHAGCTFCRETLAKLAAGRAALEAAGVRLVLVHMDEDARAAAFFKRFGLEGAWRLADPERRFYRAFGLRRGKFSEVLGLKVWLRGIFGGTLWRHGLGLPQGDVFQLPGSFLLHHGRVVRSHVPADAAGEADFDLGRLCAL